MKIKLKLKLKFTKTMELTLEEVEALKKYFDVTTINVTSLIKKIGLKDTRQFEGVIDKVYKELEVREDPKINSN